MRLSRRLPDLSDTINLTLAAGRKIRPESHDTGANVLGKFPAQGKKSGVHLGDE
jgi:hypothetical protein